jgi:hypothetical protein
VDGRQIGSERLDHMIVARWRTDDFDPGGRGAAARSPAAVPVPVVMEEPRLVDLIALTLNHGTFAVRGVSTTHRPGSPE